jgi:hypothetical protein
MPFTKLYQMKKLKDIAIARSGDKGSSANIGVIVRNPEDFPFLVKWLTEERVRCYFETLKPTQVTRYLLNNLHAVNFVLKGVLDEGGSLNLAIDAQGKALGQALLEMPIDE